MSSLNWPPAAQALLDLALEEDLGRGDLTSAATIPAEMRFSAELNARQPLVLAGVDVAKRVFGQVCPEARLTCLHNDGSELGTGETIIRVAGPGRGLLAAERTALNFLQRLSGIATMTRAFVKRLGPNQRVVDTRKTTPGLRFFEKTAVAAGGGQNHRACLGSGVLIKDNHIAASGGLTESVNNARTRAPHSVKIEVEVDTLDQLDLALAARADIVMLDNFTNDQLQEACRRVKAHAEQPGNLKPLLEVSGGITLERMDFLATIPIDVISVGALTHSAVSVDIGMDFAGL